MASAISLATSTNQIVWTIFGIFWAANAVLLVTLFTAGGMPTPLVAAVVSVVGFALSVIWFFVQRRGLRYLGFYDGVVQELEETLEVPEKVSLSKHRNKTLFQAHVGVGRSIRPLMRNCAAVSAVAWLGMGTVFVVSGSTAPQADIVAAAPVSDSLLDEDQLCEVWLRSKLTELTDTWGKRFGVVVSCDSGRGDKPGSITVTATPANGETPPTSREAMETETLLRNRVESLASQLDRSSQYAVVHFQYLP